MSSALMTLLAEAWSSLVLVRALMSAILSGLMPEPGMMVMLPGA